MIVIAPLLLSLSSCREIKETCEPDKATEVLHFTKLGGLKIIPIKTRIYDGSIKIKVSCYKNLLDKESKEKLHREETDDGYQLSTDWFVIMIPKNGDGILVTVMPNTTGRSRNVFIGFRAETKVKINIVQR
ncbi:MAG: hypothetical protein CSB03_00195 [Bacteroidia bacterium]|nr:MAG: hypothetical protein CSB03_00195 [Bacteroidia bacterium]